MADAADLAAEITERAMARAFARTAPIADGKAGECWECGRASPRLVGDRCAPCRDRKPRR